MRAWSLCVNLPSVSLLMQTPAQDLSVCDISLFAPRCRIRPCPGSGRSEVRGQQGYDSVDRLASAYRYLLCCPNVDNGTATGREQTKGICLSCEQVRQQAKKGDPTAGR